MYLNDIKNTTLVEDEYLYHDPIDPELIYDYDKNIYKSFNRNTMWFAKPIKHKIYYYSYYNEFFILMEDEESSPYYRPIEFYDHYLSPVEIDSLSNDELKEYINELKKENLCFHEYLYTNFLENKKLNTKVSFINFLQHFIKLKNYNLGQSNSLLTNQYFDETWNTINYYHLLVPRKKKYIVNKKKFTCNCINFKTKKTCKHIYYFIARLVLHKFFKNVILETQIMSILNNFLV